MKRLSIVVALFQFFNIAWLSSPQFALADFDWTYREQFNLKASPLDITSSIDGLYIYVLNPGQVSIYSILDGKVINRIPVDKSFDRISYSAKANTLFVSSSSSKIIRSIQLEAVHKFSLDGLAIKGTGNAPVTIAVFSDYQ